MTNIEKLEIQHRVPVARTSLGGAARGCKAVSRKFASAPLIRADLDALRSAL